MMACAFGMEACKQYFNTKYIRLPDLLIDLEIARTGGFLPVGLAFLLHKNIYHAQQGDRWSSDRTYFY